MIQKRIDTLNDVLDRIWNVSDKDECGMKHIGFSLVAISQNKHWTEGLDYKRPWGFKSDCDLVTEQDEQTLSKAWAETIKLRNEWGADSWMLVLSRCRYATLYESMRERERLYLGSFN